MTNVNNYQVAITEKALGDAIKAYRQDAQQRTIGMEMERFILHADGSLPDAAAHESFYLRLRQLLDDKVSVEPGAHMIEIKTGVHIDAAALTTELRNHMNTVDRTAKESGLIVVATSDLPGFSPDRLARNLIARIDPETGKTRRVWELMKAYESNGWHAIGRWGCGTTSIQLTHSVQDADTLLRWSRVHAALSSLYYAVFENRTRTAGTVHDGIRLRRLMGERGLVASYVFNARSGADFVDRYVDAIAQNRLLTILDDKGQDSPLPHPASFREIPPHAQTLGNLLQAASFSWNTCKIKPIIDDAALARGQIRLQNLLLEVRDMDVSAAAVPAIAGWFATLTESDARLREAEDRLESLGVPVRSNPALAGTRTHAAIAAVENDPACLRTVFGDAARGTTLRDAVTQLVLPMLEGYAPAGEALPLWQAAARAQTPPFRVTP